MRRSKLLESFLQAIAVAQREVATTANFLASRFLLLCEKGRHQHKFDGERLGVQEGCIFVSFGSERVPLESVLGSRRRTFGDVAGKMPRRQSRGGLVVFVPIFLASHFESMWEQVSNEGVPDRKKQGLDFFHGNPNVTWDQYWHEES